ncbi:MAG: hypothetical protein MZV65_48780 [Chromatiales bacterium]|nr:hypothetical protein [Chromatiales bacterium]
MRNDLWKGRTPERFYGAMGWLDGWRRRQPPGRRPDPGADDEALQLLPQRHLAPAAHRPQPARAIDVRIRRRSTWRSEATSWRRLQGWSIRRAWCRRWSNGDLTLIQSPAIIEWLEEALSHAAALLPAEPGRPRPGAGLLAAIVGCDIHPITGSAAPSSTCAGRWPATRRRTVQAWCAT